MKNLFKKFFVICLILGLVSVSSSALIAVPTYATDFTPDFSCRSVLGLTSWDCGVSNIDSTDSLKANIWTIVANIVTDITVIAAYLVIAYVIYGGYQYVFSGGDPGKVANGKKTLVQAFIGLAITMSASVIMGAIRIALMNGNGNIGNCDLTTTTECVDPNAMVTNLIQWVVGMVGIVAAIFVVYGGISYITSSGDAGKVQKAKQMILYALIGLIVVALAEMITAFVSNMIREANKEAGFINETTISKEVYEINQNN
jgi:hypothetical protein